MERCGASTGPWIVINTNPHRERMVLENLRMQALNACCPMIRKHRSHARRVETVLRPLFPSCLFVQANADLKRQAPAAGTKEQGAGTAPRRCRLAMATLGLLLLAAVPQAGAANECQVAFEKWALLSSARVRVVPQSGGDSAGGRGACVPTEAARQELLEELARTRGLCATFDQAAQQTRTILNINQTFIASLVVCHSHSADSEPGWVTRSAPSKSPPAAETPKVVTRPAAPPKAVAAAPPPTPPCLEIAPAQDEHFALVNRRCRGHTVLAVIETLGPTGETVCRGYAIGQSLAVRAPRTAPPRVNHECVLSQETCNKDRLGSMFPECDWQ